MHHCKDNNPATFAKQTHELGFTDLASQYSARMSVEYNGAIYVMVCSSYLEADSVTFHYECVHKYDTINIPYDVFMCMNKLHVQGMVDELLLANAQLATLYAKLEAIKHGLKCDMLACTGREIR